MTSWGHGAGFAHAAVPAAVLIAAIAGPLPRPAAADGRTEAIALQGDPAADANGQQWLFYDSPVVSDTGSVAYTVWHGSTATGAEIYGLNLWDADGLHQLARGGAAAPDANGTLSRFLTPSINAMDQVAFYAQFANTAGGSGDDRGIMIADRLGAGIVLREGQPGPNGLGTVNYFNEQSEQDPLQLDVAGRVVATTALTGIAGVSANVTRGDGVNPIEAIVTDGDPIPGGGPTFGSFFLQGINRQGDVLYRSFLNGAANGTESALVLDKFNDRQVVARAGGPAVDANGEVHDISHAGVGDGGHVAMVAQYRNTANGGNDDFAVTRHHDSGNDVVFREGDAAPSGNGTFRGGASRIGKPWVTEWGLVALNVEYEGTANGFDDDHGIVRYKQHDTWLPVLVELVREGDSAPDGDGEFKSITDIRSMNDAGVVLFEASLRNTASAGPNVGVYLTDGFDTIRVAKTVNEYGLAPDSLNAHGQVAYRAGGSPGNGATGIHLFTPDLYWRNMSSSSLRWNATGNVSDWGDNFTTTLNTNQNAYLNWTLSLQPGPVHNVIFDPDRFVGPGTGLYHAEVDGNVDATVRSLTMKGQARILMSSGKITATDGFTLEGTNRVEGHGELHGDVFISADSRVRSDGLNIYGDIENDGLLWMDPQPGSFAYFTEIHGDVLNNGRTSVDAGHIIGTNDTPMEAEFHGDFFNHGVLQIATNTHPDPRNDRADIFGDYYGPGEIVNNGTLVFHGGFFPGASPVRHEYEGTGTLELGTTAHTVMEIAGLTAGSGHADPAAAYDSIHLVDGGTLALGGTLEISLLVPEGGTTAFVPSLGDLFVLFTAGSIVGDFDSPLNLPELAPGLAWHVSRTLGNYALSVAAVPLPAGAWMLLPALAVLVRRRR